MAEEDPTIARDIAWVDEQLADPEASFETLRSEFCFLRSAAEARRFLEDIREGLEDFAAGRTVPHEVVVREMEERHRRHRSSALTYNIGMPKGH
ncbi:MAG: hypothetical protein E6G94_04660 [Alphaproteobacteria bacterium]|nr:MAG: hypothetical protein E6G94_04660 [Alphaproteobacteria bacterium]